MEKQKILILSLVLGILLLQFASADIIIPTVTKVYFEKDGQPYNGKIDFTVKGYGYSYPVGPPVEKKPGTYTPEVVDEFSATYMKYGDKIYENYYRNYRQIDYFELEAKTETGETFLIKNILSIPTNCIYVGYINGKYYEETQENSNCIRKANDENYGLCERYLKEIPESEIEKDENGYPIEQICEIRINLDEVNGGYVPPVQKTFWEKISCFFKRIFGNQC